ncbi:gamma-glutamyltransferase [Flavimaricola marinus]|uniref:Gamma-glutamyltranspeptidase n=1 Tax=Flavimaricola marinus TaxID=1819565 RepID=A0A238LIS2_9RHOB|nr:gamma-glutamyltransferase [Flavimaricola marinus]SMY09443.1 Gamma-glutamyltranspeptidase precursor [Flavimaricola marinus]
MDRSVVEQARHEYWDRRKRPAVSDKGVVTSQHFAATQAGIAVLEEGGNAVDAAVTTALTLQTAEPWMSGLGACGYMLVVEPDGSVECIEFTGRLPAKMDMDVYAEKGDGSAYFNGNAISKNDANVRGFLSVAIPGCVRGFSAALDRHGTIPFARALRPALDRARAGMEVDWHTSLTIALGQPEMRRDTGMQAIFQPDGKIPWPGMRLAMPQLAQTLERLTEVGPEDFYTGQIARDLVADLQENGNGITLEDLADYQPLIYDAIPFDFAGHVIHTPGHTSGGHRLRAALGMFEERHGAGPDGPEFFAQMARALREAYAGDKPLAPPAETDAKGSTTQINAVDATGRMVAITFTLFNRFGAYALSPRTGVLLNNGMAWYDPRPGRAASMIPKAYAHSNMCPVAITGAGRSHAVLGASGGNMIVPALAQIVALHLSAGLDVEDALMRPRMDAGAGPGIIANVDMSDAEIAALEEIAPVRPAQAEVMHRPFASPAMIGRRAEAFVGMPDISYPAAHAAALERNA